MIYATTCYTEDGCDYKVHETRDQLTEYCNKMKPHMVYTSEHTTVKKANQFIKALKKSWK